MDSSFSHVHWQYPFWALLDNCEMQNGLQQAMLNEQSEQDEIDAYFLARLKQYDEMQTKSRWDSNPMLEDGDYFKRFGEQETADKQVLQTTSVSRKRKRGPATARRRITRSYSQDSLNPSQQVR